MNDLSKEFFRRSRRMFDELDAEEHAERNGQAIAAAQAARRERIATQILTGIVAHPGGIPSMRGDGRKMVADALSLADELIKKLDQEAADAD